jgi:hypothetical protein
MTAHLPPIPKHLPAWQAEHLAWLASQGRPTRYAVPEGTVPERAFLRGAYLYRADLCYADLRGADLREADLRRADLREAYLLDANLSGAVLRGADLRGADLRDADLRDACLCYADLRDADLRGADLRGADLTGATRIACIGPVGRQGRMIYAVAHDDGPRIHAGCWWGSVEDTVARIEADYADDLAARDRYVAAVRAVAGMVTP